MGGSEPTARPGDPALMDRTNRVARSVATAGVALFLVTGAVLGAQSLTQAPNPSVNASQLNDDPTAEPTGTLQPAETLEPTETAEPSETAETLEPTEAAEPTETAEPTAAAAAAATDAAETAEPGDDKGGQGEVEADDDNGNDATAEPTETDESNDESGSGSDNSGRGSDNSGSDSDNSGHGGGSNDGSDH